MSEGIGEREVTLSPLGALNQRLKTIVEEKTAGEPVQVWELISDILRTHKGNY